MLLTTRDRAIHGSHRPRHAAIGAKRLSCVPTAPVCTATGACTTARPCRSSTTSPPMTTSCWCRRWRRAARPTSLHRDGKVSLCVLDEHWPFAYLQVYADATVERDRDLVVDVMMAVAGRMSGQPLGEEARPFVEAMAAEGGSGCRTLPAVRDLCPAAAASAPQRPGRANHPLGVGHRAVGRARPDVTSWLLGAGQAGNAAHDGSADGVTDSLSG